MSGLDPDWDFEERWADTAVRVTSPNDQVTATLYGDERISVQLAPGYYERTDTSALTAQVARLAQLVFIARTRAFFELRSEEVGHPVHPATRPVNDLAAEYDDAMTRLAVEGRSADGAVALTAVGMAHFAATLAPGTRHRLDATAFAQALSEAATALLRDQIERGGELRRFVYRDRSLDARAS